MVKMDPAQARLVAKGWWHTPYPLFKRLVFFAAANSNVLSTDEILDWLLADDQWWLWSVESQREAIRLLVELTPKLDAQSRAELEQLILTGPPRKMFKDNIEPGEWDRISDREVWLRLAKIETTSRILSQSTKTKLNELSVQHPEWQLAPDESDEFPYRIIVGDDWQNYVNTPRHRHELMQWIKDHPSRGVQDEDDWWQRCSNEFPVTATVLCGLAHEDVWPTERWREALQVWTEEKSLRRSWRYVTRVIIKASDDVLAILANSIGWWLKAQAKVFEGQDDLFFLSYRAPTRNGS